MPTVTVECRRFESAYGVPSDHTWMVNFVETNLQRFGPTIFGPVTVFRGHVKGYRPVPQSSAEVIEGSPSTLISTRAFAFAYRNWEMPSSSPGSTYDAVSVSPAVAPEDGPSSLNVEVTLNGPGYSDTDWYGPAFYLAVWPSRAAGDTSPGPIYVGRYRGWVVDRDYAPFIPPTKRRENHWMKIAFAYTANPRVIMLIGAGANAGGSYFSRRMTVYGPGATGSQAPTYLTFNEPVEYLELPAFGPLPGHAGYAGGIRDGAPFASHMLRDDTTPFGEFNDDWTWESLGGSGLGYFPPGLVEFYFNLPNYAPTAHFTVTRDGDDFTFDATGSTDTDGTIIRYHWFFEWGEGIPYEIEPDATGPVVTHRYDAEGEYQVRLRVYDNDEYYDDYIEPVLYERESGIALLTTPDGAYFTAVAEGAALRISKFRAGTASREPRAILNRLRDPSLWRDGTETRYLGAQDSHTNRWYVWRSTDDGRSFTQMAEMWPEFQLPFVEGGNEFDLMDGGAASIKVEDGSNKVYFRRSPDHVTWPGTAPYGPVEVGVLPEGVRDVKGRQKVESGEVTIIISDGHNWTRESKNMGADGSWEAI